jgi:hypothetical protein
MVAVLERFLRFLRTFFSDEITVFDMLEQCHTHTERERERVRQVDIPTTHALLV